MAPEATTDESEYMEMEPMMQAEVLACSFDQWYDKFQGLTYKSRVLPCQEGFLKFLKADGVVMPTRKTAGNDSDADSDSEWGDGGSDSSGDFDQEYFNSSEFTDFERTVDDAIKDLGGAVMPKLNWSAPKDARWVFGSLRCQSAYDAFTLMKASDFVGHDLHHCFDACKPSEAEADLIESSRIPYSLILRQWREVEEASEFRCFVHGGRLLAVSQRHPSRHFPHLVAEDLHRELIKVLCEFFELHLLNAFPLPRYTFDVSVGKAPRCKVKLVDFSPWGVTTEPLLFDWSELCSLSVQGATDGAAPELRVVPSESEVRHTKLERYHSMPVEIAQLGSRDQKELEQLFERAEATMGVQKANIGVQEIS